MWLFTSDEGTLEIGEVNPDNAHCPNLLVDPVASPAPSVFTTGVSTTAFFQFDGLLGAASSVSVTGSGTVTSIAVSGSTMTFSYTAATGDALKFAVKSADGGKTARRLFRPATVTLGPSYVADSLTQALFTHGWPASATATFDRPLASLDVDIVDDAGAPAGTLTKSHIGSTVTLTNIVVSAGASKLRFISVTDGEAYVTGLIEVPITSQAPTTPTLTSVSLSSFTYGVATPITVSFDETLQSFAPSINGSGATITTTWVAGQATAQCSVTAAADSTQLTFAVVDSNDGGADNMTHGITVSAPAQPVLNNVSVSTFTTGVEQTGVVATFDRELASIASITVSSGGVATITSSFPSSTVTFDITASASADPGYLFFNSVVSTQNSGPVTRSWQISVVAPARPWDGWTLVQQRIPPSWSQSAAQQEDNFQGTVVWGAVNDPINSWGINWETAVPGFTEVLIATKNEIDLSTWKGAGVTGHKWIQIDRIPPDQVSSGGFYYVGTINKSWNSNTSFTTNWFLRADATDPFIFATKDGFTSTTTGGHLQDCYYSDHLGGANNTLFQQGGGIKIYVR